ncbi:hypothetical protein [Hufsiella ginkgonis]|uniref:Uncharacterized protein n=1 Tax=Hufsiella ginkgonis TaxID=2695274 RepID=A0A7K1XXL6_9SPHI|nr:hypothetical protein [Hufsiella ginkgonis]MXV15755.1 hypothetical protein [Hufsiella ginkgonis]
MTTKLSFKNKNRLLVAGAAVFLLVAWNLAIRNTVNALSLNMQLEKQLNEQENLQDNPAYMRRNLQEIDLLLANYRVDSLGWSNEFWLTTSGIAARKKAEIMYEPARRSAEDDSVKTVLTQSIRMKAGYRTLVVLLDTLARVKHMGMISTVSIKSVRQPGLQESGQPVMEVSFRAIKNIKK